MKPPRININSPDFAQQLQHHLDLIWKAIEDQKGIGGKPVRFLGPLDLTGIPLLNASPSVPTNHDGSHQLGGSDEIDVGGLSGLLADAQTPHLMTAILRGGAMLGDVFTLSSEVLTLSLKSGWGLQKLSSELALLKQDAIGSVSSDDATDLPSALVLANEMKVRLNEVITYLKAAEILSDYTGYFAEGYFAGLPNGYFGDGYYPSIT